MHTVGIGMRHRTKTGLRSTVFSVHRFRTHETRGLGDSGTRGLGDSGTRGLGDSGTRGLGDSGTRGLGDYAGHVAARSVVHELTRGSPLVPSRQSPASSEHVAQ